MIFSDSERILLALPLLPKSQVVVTFPGEMAEVCTLMPLAEWRWGVDIMEW